MEKPKQLQLIFDAVAEKKQKAKELREMYSDALSNADEFMELTEKIKELREKKKVIEERIQNQLGRAWEQLEDVKSDIESDKVMMTDVAMRNLMDGVTVAVKDQFDNEYEPVWGVKFRKIK
jgi:uncharacterized coiled-coil DUF342 family protein